MTKKLQSGAPPVHKSTPLKLPKGNLNFEEIAENYAKISQGKVLRYRIVGTQMILLFVDGRKFYFNLEEMLCQP